MNGKYIYKCTLVVVTVKPHWLIDYTFGWNEASMLERITEQINLINFEMNVSYWVTSFCVHLYGISKEEWISNNTNGRPLLHLK